ncbi:putative SURF1-like protein [Austwickia sp. TVS 96-490-7B]|nr:putative SURF1-like protein [Austwickia sp. TVS 96-490-7B]
MTRRWIIALTAATAFFVICLFLGCWQWGRHVEKSSIADAVRQHYTAAPVPVDTVLPPGGTLHQDQLWTRITATGTYQTTAQQFVRNRPQKVTYGFEVVVPLTLADGTSLLIDRGWVRNGENATVLPSVPGPPTGTVTVTGWLRHGEESLGRDLPAGQLASINLSDAAKATGTRLRAAYVVLDTEQTGPGVPEPARPAPLLPPDTDIGPHFAYSLQWWGGSIVGFVLVFVYARREHHDRLRAVHGSAAPPPPRPKKKRIWDEEDE